MTDTAKKSPSDRKSSAKKKTSAGAKKASAASAFKQRNRGQTLELPSGLFITARRVELQTFLTKNTGDVPNPLMDVVSEALSKGQKAKVEDMVNPGEDGVDIDTINDMFSMVDSVLVESVVEPKITPAPTADELSAGVERDEDLLYTDEIDAVDKMFIFQWCIGGTEDLATFRREAGADLDALAEVQGGAGETE